MRKYKTLKHPLKDAIKKKYKTITNFCDKTGIERNTIYYTIIGRSYMNDSTKMVVMDALGIDISQLWGMLYQ